jgi:hypothetical protein
MRYVAQLESDQPLELPPICVCCGKETKGTVRIEPESTTTQGAALALDIAGTFFHFIHIAKFLTTLKEKKVRIPLCRRCHLAYILPAPKVRLSIGGFVLLLVASFYSLIALENIPLGMGLIVASVVLLFIIVLKNAGYETRRMPMRVLRDHGRYRYLVHSGPFVEYFQAYPNADLEGLKRKLVLRYNQLPDVVKI